MRGSSVSNCKAKNFDFFKLVLVFLYALVFYFGPQLAGSEKPVGEIETVSRQANAVSAGFSLINDFNDHFEFENY